MKLVLDLLCFSELKIINCHVFFRFINLYFSFIFICEIFFISMFCAALLIHVFPQNLSLYLLLKWKNKMKSNRTNDWVSHPKTSVLKVYWIYQTISSITGYLYHYLLNSFTLSNPLFGNVRLCFAARWMVAHSFLFLHPISPLFICRTCTNYFLC